MSRTHYKKFTAPGLPPWPRLYVDRTKQKAFVSVRHENWRTHFWARGFCHIAAIATSACIIRYLYFTLAEQDRAGFLVVMFLPGVIVWLVLNTILHSIFEPFLARRVFAVRTRLDFTPEAIVIYTRLYEKPVIVWRWHKGRPVICRFVGGRDSQAPVRPGPKSQADHDHNRLCQDAHIIQMTISRSRMPQFIDTLAQETVQRGMIVCQVQSDHVAAFTMVFAMAAALTERRDNAINSAAAPGVDLDSLNS